MSEAGIPASAEQHGFRSVSTGYAVIDLTPDDPKYPAEMAERMIEANRQDREGLRLWDTSVSVTMIVRGEK